MEEMETTGVNRARPCRSWKRTEDRRQRRYLPQANRPQKLGHVKIGIFSLSSTSRVFIRDTNHTSHFSGIGIIR